MSVAIAPRRRPVFPPALILFLVASLAFGAAAAFLAAPIVPFNSPGVSASPNTDAELLGIILTGIIFSILGFLLVYRLTQGTVGIPNRIIVLSLVVLLILTSFAVVFKVLDTGGALSSTGPGQVGNQTLPGNTTPGGNGSGNGTVTTPLLPIHLPPWVFILIPIVVVVILLVLIVPYLVARREISSAVEAAPSTRDKIRRTLASALQELDSSGNSDPRALIIACYSRLLEQVERKVGTVEVQTPSEIYRDHLVRLGIRRVTAEKLTRLFEEARYSYHIFGPEEGNQARLVFRQALADLDRGSGGS
ncbi:MAG: hypothetical protein WAN87_07465 [Thermoplasmata archaeon]